MKRLGSLTTVGDAMTLDLDGTPIEVRVVRLPIRTYDWLDDDRYIVDFDGVQHYAVGCSAREEGKLLDLV